MGAMEISVRTYNGPPPPGERLVLNGQDATDEDFSGRRLHDLTVFGSRLVRCSFAGIRAKHAFLGAGARQSLYVECSFDGARFGHLGNGGNARFERCSFRNVDFKGWTCTTVEMIDCVFTGKLRSTIFHGTVFIKAHRDQVGRERNEFLDNDFAGLSVCGITFRTGIDLTRQRLPSGPDRAYLPDPEPVLRRARDLVAGWTNPRAKLHGEVVLKNYEDAFVDGQRQLFTNRATVVDARDPDTKRLTEELFDLLRAG
jgi:hypothetical protein